VAMEKFARQIGLDLERYRTDYEAARPMLDLHEQQARAAGVRSVPSFYVNGLLVKLPRSLDAWSSYVDRILAGEDPALDA
jgi:predicted DsbA family dithiol-disulfide isomerase